MVERGGTPQAFAIAAIGVVSFLAGLLVPDDLSKTGGVLVVLGVLILLLATVIGEIEWFKIGPKGLETKFLDKPHGPAFLEAAASAPDNALAAVIPLLREDVASEIVTLPDGLEGRRLIDPDLSFIRQEENVTVFAVRRPGENKWLAGGSVSEMALPAGTELAILGDRAGIERVRERLSETRSKHGS